MKALSAAAAAVLCLGLGVANAAPPLTNSQLDKVTAGGAVALADASAHAVGGVFDFTKTYTFTSTGAPNKTDPRWISTSLSQSVSVTH